MASPFVYVQLHTQDHPRAKTFYTSLFGWRPRDEPNSYTELEVGPGGASAGMMKHMVAGAPSYWLPYVGVDDLEKSVADAQRLGGKLVLPPTEATGKGRYAIIADPTGATVGLWQAKR